MRSHNQKLDMILRGIVMTRGENGATIEEMRTEYFRMFGELWPLKKARDCEDIVSYLRGINGLMMERQECGLCIWFIDDIGSNLSDRQMDSNNNVDVSNQPDSSGEIQSNSDGSVDPLMRRRMVTSFVGGNTMPPSLSSSSTITAAVTVASSESMNSSGTIENACQPMEAKRKLSHGNGSHVEKRVKSTETDRLPLIEQNLNIHNWNSGANGVAKQVTTSTEKENSISIPNGVSNGVGIDAIECIEVNDSDYHEPIKAIELHKLQNAFPPRCKINDKSNSDRIDTVTSIDSIDDAILPPGYAIVGDDFMRSLISFQLFGGDFTDKPDKCFSYCFSGQTIRQAYYVILDKQRDFFTKHRNVIVNVGAIDILLDRNLIDIQAEFARLIKAITTIGCHPILTTIPNLLVSANNPNAKIIRQTVLLFNRFVHDLHDDGYPLIDFYSCLQPADYHQQPKITRTEHELELRLWATAGRAKIIDALERCL